MTNQTNTYQMVCGMEIHAELKTNSKMFCGCKNDPFGAEQPNTYTCPVCLGLPGALPVPNQTAIEWTIRLGLALGCKINQLSKFDRKHYFYPDLPKGYQLSQYDLPFCYDGVVETDFGPVRIHRIHLEEDTGKLVHREVAGEKVSLVDFNRGGVPLIEIVTEADITSAEMAADYARKLREIIRHLDIADCDMEQGGMRLEANVSLRKPEETDLPNYKTELKNINSFRFLQQAMEFEVKRQTAILDTGKTPVQETRGYNSTTGKTFSQRSKESAEDYRYFPDPDIPPIVLSDSLIAEIKEALPSLPEEIKKDWAETHKLSDETINSLFNYDHLLKTWKTVFELAQKESLSITKVTNMIVNKKFDWQEDWPAEQFITAFKKATATSDMSDEELQTIIEKVAKENPDEFERYKNGETKLLNFFIGQVMRAAKQKIEVPRIKKILDQL